MLRREDNKEKDRGSRGIGRDRRNGVKDGGEGKRKRRRRTLLHM
jgi:hypothetical protein